MPLALEAARLALVAVFVTAGLSKLGDRRGAGQAVAAFGVPARAAPALGALLPVVELAVAGSLVAGWSARLAAAAAALLLLVFSAAIAVNLARGNAPECRCFGQLHSAPVSWWAVARNLGVALLAVLVVAAGPGSTLGGVALAAVVAGAALLVWRGQRGGDAGLRVGAAAPGFSLPALEGGEVTLAALRGRGRPVLLVFADSACGPCIDLAPELAGWQREHADRLTIAVLEHVREPAGRGADAHGRRDVLLREDDRVSRAYRAEATPSAVLVGADGKIASHLAGGADQIRRLVAETVADASRAEPAQPLARREFLARAAGAAISAGAVLALPARTLAGARQPAVAAACPPGRKACGKGCCGPGQKCIRRAFGKPKCICNDFFFRDVCPGGCVNTASDRENCGKCGVECLPGRICVGGECRPANVDQCPGGCPPEGSDVLDGRVWCCDGKCKDLSKDRENCGACGEACTGGKRPICCDGYCRDIHSDPRHCGGCFKPCPTQGICHAGKCRDACPAPLKRCGKTCYRPKTERCCNGKVVARDDICGGGCTVCPSGKVCLDGQCRSPGGCLSCDDTPTGGFGVICCDGDCVPSFTDSVNCGGCDRKCVSPTPELASCGCSRGECYTVGFPGAEPCVAPRTLTRWERTRLRRALPPLRR